MSITTKLIVLLALILTLASYQSEQKKGTKGNQLWKDAQEIQLIGESTKLRLPNKFIRSSKFRLSKDIPVLQEDSLLLKFMQDNLTAMEFDDENIDLFVDTTRAFSFLRILNTERFYIDAASANQLNRLIKTKYEELENKSFGIKITKLDSHMKNNQNQTLLKFKYQIENQLWKTNFYESTYVITNSHRTIIVMSTPINLSILKPTYGPLRKDDYALNPAIDFLIEVCEIGFSYPNNSSTCFTTFSAVKPNFSSSTVYGAE